MVAGNNCPIFAEVVAIHKKKRFGERSPPPLPFTDFRFFLFPPERGKIPCVIAPFGGTNAAEFVYFVIVWLGAWGFCDNWENK